MKPKIEKIIIIDDSTLKIPTIKPITSPFEDIAFIKVLYKQNNVISTFFIKRLFHFKLLYGKKNIYLSKNLFIA